MVSSTESQHWHRLDNGVELRIAPPTAPAPHCQPDIPNSHSNGLISSSIPSSSRFSVSMKHLEDPTVFAVPAVPSKKSSRKHAPLTLATAGSRSKNRKSPLKKPKIVTTIIPVVELSTLNEKKVEGRIPEAPAPEVEQVIPKEPGKETVSGMVASLSGLLKKEKVDHLKQVRCRFSRVNRFLLNQTAENTLKTGATSFHDFLNRESYKPETKKVSLSSLPIFSEESVVLKSASFPSPPKSSRKVLKEDEPGSSSIVSSTKLTEHQSMQDLFGVLTVSREDMKNKTPSQLVEFVKRVESNQRREAFEKQQRPAYLLKLARTQSMDRAKVFGEVSQAAHRAVDRNNDGDIYMTDSSSGGESADEAEEEIFQKNSDMDRLVPMYDRFFEVPREIAVSAVLKTVSEVLKSNRRALYRYAASRHAISSRYTFAHRQLARAEYGYQVAGNLIQHIQQKQGVALFGGGAAEDSKPLVKSPALLHKGATPRPWDDRDLSAITKTSNAVTYLRLPTSKSDGGQSLHPAQTGLLRRKMKVVLPSMGLTYPFETYEATMWKERLSFGRIIPQGSDSEEGDQVGEDGSKEVKELQLAEAVVSSARGCARARPLIAFRKRMFVQLYAYPPRRYQVEEKPRQCDCYTRSLSPVVMGPCSCALCMGLVALPSWATHAALLRMPRSEALALVDPGYHPRLSQPSSRAVDLELSGVSVDFDPGALAAPSGLFKARPSRRAQAVDFVKSEAEAVREVRKQEAERKRMLYSADGGHASGKRMRPKPGGTASVSNRGRTAKNRTNMKVGRKRRHSSVSSDSSISSAVSSVTRSTSVGSADKPLAKRGLSRTTSKSGGQKRRHDGHADSSFVIPYGMTAPSKIEKIQYKEIVVPKFRDLKLTKPSLPPIQINGVRDAPADACPVLSPPETPDSEASCDEDLTDSAFIDRHAKCEIEERTRFSLPEKNPRKKNPNPEGVNKRKAPAKNPHVASGSRRYSTHFSRTDARRKSVKGKKGFVLETSNIVKASVFKEEEPEKPPPSLPTLPVLSPVPSPMKTVSTVAVRRPRKTPEEVAALYAQRSARPVRTRKSTFRISPDNNGDG